MDIGNKMRYAFIYEGLVQRIEDLPEFPMVGLPLIVVQAPAIVKEYWRWDGINFLPPNLELLKEPIIKAVQQRLDVTAQERGYDNMLSLCTYATSSIPKFRAEAQAGIDWRDACWAKCYSLMEEVALGTRNIYSIDDVLNELPSVGWSI